MTLFLVNLLCIIYLILNNLAHNILKNATSSLAKDGFFICTIPDANVIAKRLRNKGQKNALGEYVCGNEFYSMKFESKTFSRK